MGSTLQVNESPILQDEKRPLQTHKPEIETSEMGSDGSTRIREPSFRRILFILFAIIIGIGLFSTFLRAPTCGVPAFRTTLSQYPKTSYSWSSLENRQEDSSARMSFGVPQLSKH